MFIDYWTIFVFSYKQFSLLIINHICLLCLVLLVFNFYFLIIAGGHINPAVTFGLFLARKVSLVRAIMYMVAQCLGAICGCGLVKAFQKAYYVKYGGGANELSAGYNTGTGLGAEIIGTFVLVYTVFSATDPKRNARDSHVPVSIILNDVIYTWCTYRDFKML